MNTANSSHTPAVAPARGAVATVDVVLPVYNEERVLAGHSDMAVGSRLLFGSHVRRQIKREVLSRGYNRLLRTVLRARFSDAQCCFKALRTDALAVLDDVRDHQWFF